MHKLLIHSSQIIPNFELPIGFYTEEALEARNKDNKSIRLFHTRKMSRMITMTDQFNRLHVTSDPYISTQSMFFRRSKKKTHTLPEDAAKIALNDRSEINQESDESDEEGSDTESIDLDANQNEMEIDIDVNKEFETLIESEENKIIELENTNFYSDF